MASAALLPLLLQELLVILSSQTCQPPLNVLSCRSGDLVWPAPMRCYL